MIEFLRDFIISVTAAGLIGAAAITMTPEGPVKKITRITAGLVILIAVLRPIGSFRPEEIAYINADYRKIYDEYTNDLTLTNESLTKAIIEDQTATYIFEKGDELGIELKAEVTARKFEVSGKEIYLPYAVEIKLSGEAENKNVLARYIEAELGIPAERQVWKDAEGTGKS